MAEDSLMLGLMLVMVPSPPEAPGTFVLVTKPSFVRTPNTSALLTGLVKTALKRVPSSVICVRSWGAYEVTATIGVFWLALLVDLIILAAFSPSTRYKRVESATQQQ